MTDLLSRALRVIPSGCNTFSKSRAQWPANAPSHLGRGRGGHVWDAQQREYIDFTLGLGPIILGYKDPEVEHSVRLALDDGPIFSMPYQLEVAIAEMLTEVIPCAEMVKFGLNGSDATTAAVRCARAHTGRDVIRSHGYHGWSDTFSPNTAGIPQATRALTEQIDLGDDMWDAVDRNVAAVIIEPDNFSPGMLRRLRENCDRAGALLIFDEVLTGFRIALGGYQEYSGVTPDLATFSKAMGNGYPISAVVGKREYMQTFERIGFSGTFLGSTPGLAATGAVIRKMRAEPVIARLWEHGNTIKSVFTECAKESGIDAELTGLAPRLVFRFKGDTDVDPIIRDRPARLAWRTLFAQSLIERGILANFGFTFAYAHSDSDIERACEAIRDAFEVLANVDKPEDALIGEAASPGLRAA
ncbi:MAG: aminotransferase class III-fold pyridoxal phosphate-dependent enzyme [Gemmatimonadaceae bacterium]|nr:aminotransferase class III-fold pyridoxal phosphate-dependent enzyme [Gemmatimonadaceae bacterium]